MNFQGSKKIDFDNLVNILVDFIKEKLSVGHNSISTDVWPDKRAIVMKFVSYIDNKDKES